MNGNTPPRGEAFSDAATRAVWAAICALPIAAQHEVLAALRLLLSAAGRQGHDDRVRVAVGALREAAELLGKSPSVDEYRRLRAEHPEFDWPADGSVRRWLGGSWNDALEQARLERVPDGDVVVAQLGPAFTVEEIIEALRTCASELQRVPTFHEYLAWARRPDVKARAGRRPTSQPPFVRVFGGYREAVVAADLVNGETLVELPRSTRVRVASYFVDDKVVTAALRLVAERIGHSPRLREYLVERERILAESEATGEIPALPSPSIIQKRYGTWDNALVAADPPPATPVHHPALPGTRLLPPRRRGRRRSFFDSQ